jgi:hypothetical protein
LKGDDFMLSVETLEEYRKMTIAQRLSMTLAMMRDAAKYLTAGPADVVDRRFELIRRQNDERTRNMLTGLARASMSDGKPVPRT